MMKNLKVFLAVVFALCSQWAFALININTASIEELENLKGIGRVKATAIVEYRNQHGAFKQLEDLLKVKGIGKATLDKIAADLSFDVSEVVAEEKKEETPNPAPASAEQQQ